MSFKTIMEPYTMINTKRQIFDACSNQIENLQKEESFGPTDDQPVITHQPLQSAEPNHMLSIRLYNAPNSQMSSEEVFPSQQMLSCRQFSQQLSEDRRTVKKGLNEAWKINGFRIITLVSRFIRQLKSKSDSSKLKMINKDIFNYILDKSSDYVQFKKQQIHHLNWKMKINNKLTDIIEYLYEVYFHYLQPLVDKVGVIQPDSTFKLWWDLIVVLFIVINIFYIPMSLSFELDVKFNIIVTLFFETIPSSLFLIEILLNFNTAFYSQGVIHNNRQEIFKHYVATSFFWDLMIVIPYLLSQFNIPYIQFILLLRVTRVPSMIESLEDSINVKESVQGIFELSKLVYFVIFTAHLCGCAWHFLGMIEADIYHDKNSWIIVYDLYNEPWYNRYVVSLYWSVITTLTVGYGDIVPKTTVERLFVMIVALIICGVLGYAISTIGEILKNLQEQKQLYKQQMKEINQYIKDKQLNKQLSLKVRKYFEYQIQLTQYANSLHDQVTQKLSDSLKSEVMIDIYKKILAGSKFLRKNFDDALIEQLCQQVKCVNYAPGDEIIQLNESSDKLYFVIEGVVQSYSKGLDIKENSQGVGKQLNSHTKGSVIGELEFVINGQHLQCYKAQTFTKMAYIERGQFIDIIRQDEQQIQRFSEYKDKLTFSYNFGRVCEICKWTHKYTDCPFVFYQPNMNKIVREATQNVKQRRTYQIRAPRYLSNKADRNEQIEACLSVQFNNGMITEDQVDDNHLKRIGLQYITSMSQCKSGSIKDVPEKDDEISSSKPSSMIIDHLKIGKLRETLHCRPSAQLQLHQKSGDQDLRRISKRHSRTSLRTPDFNALNMVAKETISEQSMEKEIQFQLPELLLDVSKSYDNYFNQFNLSNIVRILNISQSKPLKHQNKYLKHRFLKLKPQKQVGSINLQI